jgi:C4-dicarboxylate-binding protein DctP
MPTRRTSLRQLALPFAVPLLLATDAVAQATRPEVLIRFSHVVAPDTPKGQMAQHFQTLVAQRSQGRIRVELYPDSQLYGDDDEMDALRFGAVDMLAPSLSKFGNVGVPEFEVFDLPFLFQNLQQVRRVTQGPLGQQLLERLGRQQMLGLGFMDSGFKQLSGRKSMRTPADLRGQRMRVQASRVLVAQMRAWGAQPVVLPFGETRRALSQGVVDGAENPLSNLQTQGLAALQPHITLTHHGYLGYVVVTHPRFWASLPPHDQALLRQALAEALELGNRLSAELDQKALQALRQTPGIHLHTLTDPQRAAWIDAARPVYTQFRQSIGAALLRDIQRVK